jgi:hypothetical protein
MAFAFEKLIVYQKAVGFETITEKPRFRGGAAGLSNYSW